MYFSTPNVPNFYYLLKISAAFILFPHIPSDPSIFFIDNALVFLYFDAVNASIFEPVNKIWKIKCL